MAVVYCKMKIYQLQVTHSININICFSVNLAQEMTGTLNFVSFNLRSYYELYLQVLCCIIGVVVTVVAIHTCIKQWYIAKKSIWGYS